MRALFMLLLIVGLMSSVGVYAATFGGGSTVKTVGGTGTQTVSAPTSGSVDASWTLTGDDVSAVVVKWTPTATGTYTVSVDINGSNHTATGLAGTAATLATHTVPVSPAVATNTITSFKVAIATE